jgi:D-inositol-3-phosphate glycosyltransferase
MRIAMLSLHTSPMEQPGSGDAGGMNVYIRNLSLALGALGHEVHMFTRTADESTSSEVSPAVFMHQVQIRPGAQLSKEELPDIIDEAASLLKEHMAGLNIDIIHGHYWLSGMVGLQLAEAWKIPLVVSLHTSAAAKEFESGIPEPEERKEAERRLLAGATRIIANTPVEARQLSRFYSVDKEKLDVVLPGVDHKVFHPDQNKLRRPLGADDLHLVYALFGANSGSADYDLPALAEKHSVADVLSFFGPLQPAQLAAVFANADVVAVPSLSETFGLVAAEAQACGTPVLANHVGGLAYAVNDGESGWLMEDCSPHLWAQQLLTLARNPAMVTQAGHAALEHSGEFTWERAAVTSLASYRMASTPAPTPSQQL